MGKITRYHEPNTPYFITTVTDKRKKVFTDKLACELLINVLTYNKFYCDYSVYGFVIMPDHLHLILQPHGTMEISQIIKKNKANFTRYYNKMNNSKGTIWQPGFYDRGLKGMKSVKETLEYIHNNPLRKSLVDDIREYEYSSYNYYANTQKRFQLLLKPLAIE